MEIPERLTMAHPEDLVYWPILIGYRGSIAHGMYLPNTDPNSVDDIDAISVCVPPLTYYFGTEVYGSRGTKEIKHDEWDIVSYELRKFVSLLRGGNPNVLGLLWLKKHHYLKTTQAGRLLLANRDLFVGKHVYHSFVGYARGQLKKMTHFSFEGYMGEKRKKLVEQYGYDCKNAAHMIRLLRMGIEFLETGTMYVYRHDASELLAIKRGEWPLYRVQEEADMLFERSYDVYLRSTLPEYPDREKIDNLCVDIVEENFCT